MDGPTCKQAIIGLVIKRWTNNFITDVSRPLSCPLRARVNGKVNLLEGKISVGGKEDTEKRNA
ncbi:hypothetical protein HDU67_009783, partial [Dinochytrium kinnereticum]